MIHFFLLAMIYDARVSHILLFYDSVDVIFPFRSQLSEITFLSEQIEIFLSLIVVVVVGERSRRARDCHRRIRDVINIIPSSDFFID